jgi:beta-glucosidase
MRRSVMRIACLVATCLLGACGHSEVAPTTYPFQNPDLALEARVDNIVSLLTLDEKIACLGTNPSVARLGIRGSDHLEGLHGLALGGPGGWGGWSPVPTTTFPQAIGLAETWDPEVVQRAAAIEGYEARYVFQNSRYQRGGLVIRAPNADLGRDPRWGRTEECYGEDAFFNGTMAVAFVRGLQGDHPVYWQTASLLKHFLANSNEDNRGSTSSNFDERLLREYYSLPFRMGVVAGGARAYMTAYNAVNGVPCTVHPILRAITIDEWGQDGIICTDAGALGGTVSDHRYFADVTHAAAAAVQAGINQFLDANTSTVRSALAAGLLREADVDRVLKGNFRVMIRLGLLDPPERVPYASIGTAADAAVDPWTTDAHKSVARLVTQKSIVLLKNTQGLLPLDKATPRSIAVIGARANDVALDWYSGTPPYTVSPLQGIRSKVGAGVTVSYAADNSGDAAVNLARMSDVAIVCVGNHPTCNAGWARCPLPSDGKEAIDRRSITLEQEELVQQVYLANPRTVVVLISSFPFAINWTAENVPTLVHMTHNSQETGNALADVLFGDYNPGGRLVQTWPRSLDQLPPMMDYDIRNGRTYMHFSGEPLFPFGYGLSYTTFAYSGLTTSSGVVRPSDTITVSLDVQNTGERAGEEVVQMYVRYPDSRVTRPIQELKGFRRVSLQPGERTRVELALPASSLTYWDEGRHAFALEPGRIEVRVGSSSADIRLTCMREAQQQTASFTRADRERRAATRMPQAEARSGRPLATHGRHAVACHGLVGAAGSAASSSLHRAW